MNLFWTWKGFHVASLLMVHQINFSSGLDISKELAALRNTLESQSELLAHQQRHIDGIREKVEQLEANDDVAFSAYLRGSSINKQFPKAFSQVNFTGVQTNHGDHYDPEVSMFTCPTDGVYFFSLTLQSVGMQAGTSHFLTSGTLILGHQQKAEVYTQNGMEEGMLYLGGTNMVITECKRGEQVKVMSLQPGNGMLGSRSDMRCTLLGMRLVNLEKVSTGQSQASCQA